MGSDRSELNPESGSTLLSLKHDAAMAIPPDRIVL
jgi:hypothetical protein